MSQIWVKLVKIAIFFKNMAKFDLLFNLSSKVKKKSKQRALLHIVARKGAHSKQSLVAVACIVFK